MPGGASLAPAYDELGPVGLASEAPPGNKTGNAPRRWGIQCADKEGKSVVFPSLW